MISSEGLAGSACYHSLAFSFDLHFYDEIGCCTGIREAVGQSEWAVGFLEMGLWPVWAGMAYGFVRREVGQRGNSVCPSGTGSGKEIPGVTSILLSSLLMRLFSQDALSRFLFFAGVELEQQVEMAESVSAIKAVGTAISIGSISFGGKFK